MYRVMICRECVFKFLNSCFFWSTLSCIIHQMPLMACGYHKLDTFCIVPGDGVRTWQKMACGYHGVDTFCIVPGDGVRIWQTMACGYGKQWRADMEEDGVRIPWIFCIVPLIWYSHNIEDEEWTVESHSGENFVMQWIHWFYVI